MKQIIRLTESDLHRIIENSVKHIINESAWSKGYVRSDGNHMVGGEYGSRTAYETTNVLEKVLDTLVDMGMDDDEFDSLAEYLEENESAFNIGAEFTVCYDESTGYGSAYSPIFELQDVKGVDKALNVISQYPNEMAAEMCKNAFNKVIEDLDESYFDFDSDYLDDDDYYDDEY